MSTPENHENEPIRLTLALSGAISLGSYQAGVVAQIGYAVAKHNESVGEEGRKIFIDVIAGASAGSLTGAHLTRFIATGCKNPVAFVKENFDTWCGDELSILNMLDPNKVGPLSVLSNSVIDELAAKVVPNDPGPIALAYGQDALVYSCTLTSHKPISLWVKLPSPGSLRGRWIRGSTRLDTMTFGFTSNTMVEIVRSGQLPGEWSRVRSSALGSGAFPFAWAPVEIDQPLGKYGGSRGRNAPDKRISMTYSDGGIMDNMPLGRAGQAIREASKMVPEATSFSYSSRTLILIGVSPEMRTGLAEDAAKSPGRSTQIGLLPTAGVMFDGLREQSFYHDLRMFVRVNHLLDSIERNTIPQLVTVAQTVSSQVAQSAKDALESAAIELEMPLGAPNLASLSRSMANHMLSETTLNGDSKKYATDTLALLLIQSDLVGKVRFSMLDISPKDYLEGSRFGNFGGFIDRNAMIADFATGLERAHEQLTSFWKTQGLPNEPARAISTLQRISSQVPNRPPKLRNLETLDPVKRRKFNAALRDRIVNMATPNWFLRIVLRLVWGATIAGKVVPEDA